MGGKEAKVRCTLIEADDALTGRWEYAEDGEDWKPSWDVKSVRTGAGRGRGVGTEAEVAAAKNPR